MIERVAEKAVTAPGVTARQPLNFQLYYGDSAGRAQTINTVYLEDGNPKLDLCLAVFNESSGKITFKAAPSAKLSLVGESDSAASAEKCHFSLRFEKDLKIEPKVIEVEPKDDWQVTYSENDYFITIYFLSEKELVLQPKTPDNDSDTVKLIFKDLAAYNGTIKSSNVELTYGSSLLLNSKGDEVSPTSSKNAISVTNHPDHRDIPLQFRFIGPNTILNDGTTQNSLKLQIINRPPSNNTRPNLLLDEANSKFIVSFEIGAGAEALTTQERVKAIKLTATNTKWDADKTQNDLEGTVKLTEGTKKEDQKLGSGETIELEIKDIQTNNPSGVSYMYIAYQNIVGYPDGRLVVPIEKTPLLYRDKKENNVQIKQVGIGTNNPTAKLHVSGGDAFISGKLTSTGDAIIDGKVGIGISTISPNAKLEVSGNIKATGAIQPSAGHTNNEGIIFPKPPSGHPNLQFLQPDRLDAAWIRYYVRAGDSYNLEIGISNDPDDHIVLMPTNGNVGIGTNLPSAKLNVNGRIKDKTGWVMPVGSILPYAGATAPEGWLLCQGQELDKTHENNKYQDLFEVIGHKYTSNGSGNKFKLPDLKGRIPAGFSSNDSDFNQLGKIGGSKTHTLTVDQMPSHNHNWNDKGHSHTIVGYTIGGGASGTTPGNRGVSDGNTNNVQANINFDRQGGGQAHNNLQPYLTVNYIIKY